MGQVFDWLLTVQAMYLLRHITGLFGHATAGLELFQLQRLLEHFCCQSRLLPASP